MSELRKRMIECLQLRGLAERTQEAYTRAVCQLAAHYHKSPDQISEAELRQYFLYLKNVKRYSRNTMTVAICGIRFFYEQTLQRNWAIFGIVRPAPEKKLPVILSLAEVRQILGRVRLPRYQVCLTTIYSCGLRLQEGTHLQVADIDSARMIFTSVTARAPKTATCRCRNERSSCCASTGLLIATPCCSFPPKAVVTSTWRRLPSRCRRAASRTPSARRSKKAVSTNAHPYTRCAIPGPHICSKPGSTCG